MLKKILTIVGISAGISVVIYGTIAGVLIASNTPHLPQPSAASSETSSETGSETGSDSTTETSGGSLSFAEAINLDYSTLPDTTGFTARDGSELHYRSYPGGTDRLIVLVHGSGWHGMQFHAMAHDLAERGLGTVLVPDLRGHGAEPVTRGDVDYIGQLEDDLADLVTAAEGTAAYDTVVLGGHSSGGGLAIRFAGGEHADLVDEYILMAPYLKYDAPTTKPNSGGWAQPATQRIIGLTMLNNVGITALNHLPAISFDMPQEVLDGPFGDTATTQYSFRLNTSFAPRNDFEADLAALQKPFLLIAGADDEAFIVDEYKPTISAQTQHGEYQLLDGISHIGVTTDQTAIDAVTGWISQH